jgi:DNA-binding response OmpR family regulator
VKKPVVLVIEDERRYRELLELNLVRRGYQAILAPDGLSGLNLLERDSPDLVVLDLMLPDLDGYEVCRRIREYSQVPIIMLTARAEEAQKVRGLRLGADDYITKPFGADELLARVEAVLRRVNPPASATPKGVQTGDLTIDYDQHLVTLRGRDVDLSPIEYRLLQQLALNVGRIVVLEELIRRVWGPDYVDDPALVHTNIRRLRRKLEDDPDSPRYVLTRRGVGYSLARLDPPPSESSAAVS